MEGGKRRAVMLNLFQHRQIEVNKPKSSGRKRDFRALATLKQVQGDGKACRHSELVSESPD